MLWACCEQKGQPVMRADGGRLQLGVVIDPHTEEGSGRGMLIATKNGSRLLPGARIEPESCRCSPFLVQRECSMQDQLASFLACLLVSVGCQVLWIQGFNVKLHIKQDQSLTESAICDMPEDQQHSRQILPESWVPVHTCFREIDGKDAVLHGESIHVLNCTGNIICGSSALQSTYLL